MSKIMWWFTAGAQASGRAWLAAGTDWAWLGGEANSYWGTNTAACKATCQAPFLVTLSSKTFCTWSWHMHVLYYMEVSSSGKLKRWGGYQQLLTCWENQMGARCIRDHVICMERLDCLPSVYQTGHLKAISLMGKMLCRSRTHRGLFGDLWGISIA